MGSHVAQLVGCWTHNQRVVGSIPSENILGQDVNLDCVSLHPGVMAASGFLVCALYCGSTLVCSLRELRQITCVKKF